MPVITKGRKKGEKRHGFICPLSWRKKVWLARRGRKPYLILLECEWSDKGFHWHYSEDKEKEYFLIKQTFFTI